MCITCVTLVQHCHLHPHHIPHPRLGIDFDYPALEVCALGEEAVEVLVVAAGDVAELDVAEVDLYGEVGRGDLRVRREAPVRSPGSGRLDCTAPSSWASCLLRALRGKVQTVSSEQ